MSMAESKRQLCLYLRTKTAYFRTPEGERMFDPESATACYTCLKTRRLLALMARLMLHGMTIFIDS